MTAITYSCIAPLVIAFGAIGLYLFYFAYRYNMLYVSNADIDTQGKAYVRGLQHITVGCYLLMGCLIGLFAIGAAGNSVAVGPMILMIIFLVFIIIYHVSLNNAMRPLINYLPKNLEAEEEALLAHERAEMHQTPDSQQPEGSVAGGSGEKGRVSNIASVDSAEKGLTGSSETPQGNFLVRWLHPNRFSGYTQLRRLVPNPHDTTQYAPEVERDAYFHPAISAQAPLLWIPRDELGVSRQEIQHSSKVIPITDEDSWLDEKNKIHWDMNKGVPPIYQDKIHF